MSELCDVTSGHQGIVYKPHLWPVVLAGRPKARRLLYLQVSEKFCKTSATTTCDVSLLASSSSCSLCAATQCQSFRCPAAGLDVAASSVLEDAHLLAMDIQFPPCRPCSPQQRPRYQPPHLRRRSSSSSGAVSPACHMLYQTATVISDCFPLSESCVGLRLASNTTALLHDGTCLLRRLAMSSRCASPLRPCSLLHKVFEAELPKRRARTAAIAQQFA